MNEIVEQKERVLPVWLQAMEKSHVKFNNVNQENLIFEKEAGFAKQAIMNNDFLMKVANNNPSTLMDSIVNIAAVGLSLNPATQYAYIVPRDNRCCLDISYKGLIKIATDSGSILWAQADVVYQNDSFEYRGVTKKPRHSADVFGDRGQMIGAYCVAKTSDGDYLTEIINKDQMEEIKSSAHGVDSKYSPWNRYPDEMYKKACIKRASKTWPKTQVHERIHRAIQIINEHEGNNFEPFTKEQKEMFDQLVSDDQAVGLYGFIKSLDKENWIALYNSGEKGKKTALKTRCKELEKEGFQSVESIKSGIEADDDFAILENIEGLCDDSIYFLMELLEANERNKINLLLLEQDQ